MLEVIELLVYAVVTTSLFFAILRFDEAYLSPEQLARGWTMTSKLAVVGCGLLGVSLFFHLGIIVHFWRTRRSLSGIGLGAVVAMHMFLIGVGLLVGIGWIAGEV
jgi:hypothetical protein